MLPVVLATAQAVEYALLPYGDCTEASPCPPEPLWNLMDGLHVGALLAVPFVPGAGLPVFALTTVPYLVAYAVAGELGSSYALGSVAQLVVALAGAAWLLRSRLAPLPRARSARLPERGRNVLASRGLGTVELAAVLAVVAGLAFTGWFAWLQAATAAHLDRAEPTTLEVVRVDDEDYLLEVRVPGTSGTTRVGVVDTSLYAPGDQAPALADRTVEPAWVSLDAEPVEHDGWLVLAGALAVIGAVVGGTRAWSLRQRRRLLVEGGPAWSTTMTDAGDGTRVLLAGLGLRAQLVRAMRADGVLEAVGLLRHQATADLLGREPSDDRGDEDHERSRQQDFVQAWRGEGHGEPGPDDEHDRHRRGQGAVRVVLVGDPRPGGVVLVVTDELVLAPVGVLVPMSPLERRRVAESDTGVLPGSAPGDAGQDLDASGLPGVVAVPLPRGVEPRTSEGGPVGQVALRLPRRRLLGAAALLVLPIALWLTADGSLPPEERVGLLQSAGLLFAAGSIAFGGVASARASASLRPEAVRVCSGGFLVEHPWASVAGVRLVDDEVVVAFGVGEDGDVDAVGGRPVGIDPPTAAGLAERWRRDAATADMPTGQAPRRTVDPVVWGGLVLYALVALGSLGWPLLPG